MSKNTACPVKDRNLESINRSIETMKGYMADGAILHGHNQGTGSSPKIYLYVVVPGYTDEFENIHPPIIRNVTASVAFACAFRWNNNTGWIHGFNCGGGPVQYIAERLAKVLGVDKIQSEII